MVLLLLAFPEAGSQSRPSLRFPQIPAYGVSADLAGEVSGFDSSGLRLFVFYFIPDIGWVWPNCSDTPIKGDGTFRIGLNGSLDRFATRFSAFIVPAGIAPACRQSNDAIPFEFERNAVAAVTIPRLVQQKSILFSGLEWYVKSPPLRVYPGPQFFEETNAFVDAAGRLHLKIRRCGDTWCAAEVYTKERVGYGTYSFTIDQPLNDLDSNTTLGIFTWDATAQTQNHREWDVEFGRWGNANATANAQFVVQPYTVPGNITRFLMSSTASSTTEVSWTPNAVQFRTTPTSGGAPVAQWAFNGITTPVPDVGSTHLHLNFYVASGQAPALPVEREIIISRANYVPAGNQIGFASGRAEQPFGSSSGSAGLAGAPGCTATAESDSPWLSIVGPRNLSAGGLLQFRVDDNPGTPRSGHLILTGEGCTLTAGRQLFEVSQSGLVCDSSFASNESTLGFLPSLQSVFIKGSVPTCRWTVTTNSPFTRISSASAGVGDGSVDFNVERNPFADVRQGQLILNNSKVHTIYQDGSASMLGLTPEYWNLCSPAPQQFSISWLSNATAVELRLSSPDGVLLGGFAPSGSALLPPNLADGTLVFLLGSETGLPRRVLASTRVSVRPSDCNAARIATGGVVNAASFATSHLAPGSSATIFGERLSTSTGQARQVPLPEQLAGSAVTLGGQPCALSYVSPTQINLVVPPALAPGRHRIVIGAASAEVLVGTASPGIFTLDGRGRGAPFAAVTAILESGEAVVVPSYLCAAQCEAVRMIVPSGTVQLYLVLYGTGLRGTSASTAYLGDTTAEVLYAGPTSQFPGVDQMNLRIQSVKSLTGLQKLRVRVDGFDANTVDLLFR